MITDVGLLDQKLKAAGIPIAGISKSNGVYQVEFLPEATQQQRDQAAAIVAAFDPNEITAYENRLRLAREGLRASDFAALKAELVAASTLAQIKVVIGKTLRNQYRLTQALEFISEDDPG